MWSCEEVKEWFFSMVWSGWMEWEGVWSEGSSSAAGVMGLWIWMNG